MRTRTASLPWSVLLGGIVTLLLVAACGGTGGTTSAPPDGGAKSAAPTSGTPATAAANAPTAAAGGGGGTASGACELATAAELAPIFKVASVKATLLAGPPDACILASDTGVPLGSWSYTTTGAKATYDAITTSPSTVAVSGIGDKAAFVENVGLAVLKGDRMFVVSLSAGVSDLSKDEQDAISKAIAAIAAGRM